MEKATNQAITEIIYPSLSERVQSTFIDLLLIIGLMFLAAKVLDSYGEVPNWIRIVLFFGLWAIYEPVCTMLGATVGNLIKNLRVRQVADTNRKINIIQAFFRYILKAALGWISFLTIHSNKERRAIHDLAVGSVMIRK